MKNVILVVISIISALGALILGYVNPDWMNPVVILLWVALVANAFYFPYKVKH